MSEVDKDTAIAMRLFACPTFGCGVVFSVPASYADRRVEDKKQFYCPNGHTMSYPGKTSAQYLRERLTDKETELESAWSQIRKLKRAASKKRKP